MGESVIQLSFFIASLGNREAAPDSRVVALSSENCEVKKRVTREGRTGLEGGCGRHVEGRGEGRLSRGSYVFDLDGVHDYFLARTMYMIHISWLFLL